MRKLGNVDVMKLLFPQIAAFLGKSEAEYREYAEKF